jgi:hypothetical protein
MGRLVIGRLARPRPNTIPLADGCAMRVEALRGVGRRRHADAHRAAARRPGAVPVTPQATPTGHDRGVLPPGCDRRAPPRQAARAAGTRLSRAAAGAEREGRHGTGGVRALPTRRGNQARAESARELGGSRREDQPGHSLAPALSQRTSNLTSNPPEHWAAHRDCERAC